MTVLRVSLLTVSVLPVTGDLIAARSIRGHVAVLREGRIVEPALRRKVLANSARRPTRCAAGRSSMTVFRVRPLTVLAQLVTHDPTTARRVGGRGAVTRAGRIPVAAPPEKTLARPAAELLTAPLGDRP
ncbi:hypothetical protein [Streptomyces hokutonensis]|uniref:hypothetical protein n=1 Tax=Streptomyces hokutonensis TaxID=1306990 RepID=UPI0036756E5B